MNGSTRVLESNRAARSCAFAPERTARFLGISLGRFTRGRTGSLTGVRLTGALVRIHSQASALLGKQSAKRREIVAPPHRLIVTEQVFEY
jgi:hypothetical protein